MKTGINIVKTFVKDYHQSNMKLYKEQLEIILGEVVRLQSEHPKANVYYDVERKGIKVIYPLPKDFYKLSSKLEPLSKGEKEGK